MMKLTIIPSDGTVSCDGLVYLDLDLGSCSIPSDVHALQWSGDDGWIEYVDHYKPNEEISLLPAWANLCADMWARKDYEEKNPPPPAPPSEIEVKTERMDQLKQMLRDTDFVTLSDYDQEKPEVIANRALWRSEIRDLEKQLVELLKEQS